MSKRVRTGLKRADILDCYIERLKKQLNKFQPFLWVVAPCPYNSRVSASRC
jgi:hypothetical protein